jgi:2-polyprenyl-6-methoxyphenol hydroxylase-like FAD-dependent oxidoreductase
MSYSASPSAILIVGAGPTGLTLAHELLRRGVKPRLIEKAPHPSRNTKALGVMARTLELLAPSGITKDLLAQGVRVSTFGIWSAGRQVARLDFATGMDSPYPYVLMLPQHTIEAMLTEQVARQGGTVERGVELVGLTQRAEGIEAVLRHGDETEERTCSSYLIGCDGAHSTVRHLLGAPFVGTAVAQQFVTGDVRMRWKLPHDQALVCFNRGHLIAYFPLPDGQHRFLSVSPGGEAVPSDGAFEEIQRVIDACGPPGARATDPSWLARYQVHRRMVDCYVYQRVLLAGDAAHIHSPLGAQGMNAGMQDATNLAWKLALVAQGGAPARLLESYHVERAEVGARLLQEDAVLTRLACLRHPLATATRDRVAPCVSRHPLLQQFITRTAAGLRVSYHHGPLALDYRGSRAAFAASAVKVGGRAPNGPVVTSRQSAPSQLYDLLTGTGHALLLFTARLDEERRRAVQSALADWQGLLEIYPIRRCKPVEGGERTWHDPDGALAERYGIADEGLVLVRPDGYISFRSRSLAAEPLQRYLRAHFSPPYAS